MVNQRQDGKRDGLISVLPLGIFCHWGLSGDFLGIDIGEGEQNELELRSDGCLKVIALGYTARCVAGDKQA